MSAARRPRGIVVRRGCVARRVLADRMNLGPKNSFKETNWGRKVLAETRDGVNQCGHAIIYGGIAGNLCYLSLLPPYHIWWQRVLSFSNMLA